MFDKNAKFLVCDDSPLSRAVIKKELTDAGYNNIVEAENGQIALDIINADFKNAPIELLFLDMNMPELDGLGLVAKLKDDENFEELPIIMISAESDSGLVIKAIAMDVSHYLVKPVSQGDVIEKMEAVWEAVN